MPAAEPEKYRQGVDLAGIDAIDIHTHVEVNSRGHRGTAEELIAATEQYFKLGAERLFSVRHPGRSTPGCTRWWLRCGAAAAAMLGVPSGG